MGFALLFLGLKRVCNFSLHRRFSWFTFTQLKGIVGNWHCNEPKIIQIKDGTNHYKAQISLITGA